MTDFLAGIGVVVVVVVDGEDNEEMVIKISDLGGGFPRSVTSPHLTSQKKKIKIKSNQNHQIILLLINR
jgi:hypothetical protein